MIGKLWYRMKRSIVHDTKRETREMGRRVNAQEQVADQARSEAIKILKGREGERDLSKLYGEMRPFWEQDRQPRHDHP